MTRLFQTFLISLAFMSLSVHAHSIEDVEASLHEKERYAQFVDRPAPPFTLTDSKGNTLSLADLQGGNT